MTTKSRTDGKPVEILLVEDNPDDAVLLHETLKNVRFPTHLTVARDGEEATESLYRRGPFGQNPRPDMILLDLRLPFKSGLDVLSEIKLDPNFEDIPVMIFTNSNEDDVKALAYQLKANFYIVKPVGFEQSLELAKYLEEFWIKRVST